MFLSYRTSFSLVTRTSPRFKDDFPTDNSPNTCKQLFLGAGVSTSLVILLSEAILFIRLYGFSGRDQRVLAFILVTYFGILAASSAFFAKFYYSVVYSDDFPLPRVCVHESGDHQLLGVVFALYLASVVVAMLGMMFIMFRKYKAYRSSLITAFLRDGIGYFVCLSALATANIVLNFVPGLKPWYKFILCPYVLLHLHPR
ncbi:hypothetical protein MD484_g5225, partial [Candolleomyces efflorescens]